MQCTEVLIEAKFRSYMFSINMVRCRVPLPLTRNVSADSPSSTFIAKFLSSSRYNLSRRFRLVTYFPCDKPMRRDNYVSILFIYIIICWQKLLKTPQCLSTFDNKSTNIIIMGKRWIIFMHINSQVMSGVTKIYLRNMIFKWGFFQYLFSNKRWCIDGERHSDCRLLHFNSGQGCSRNFISYSLPNL